MDRTLGHASPGIDAGVEPQLPALSGVTDWLVDDGDLTHAMRRVAELALRLIPGCDLASVTLLSPGGPETVAATHEAALTLDMAQYALDDGPCLVAARTGVAVLAENDEAWHRWPLVASQAEELGVRSFLATPLVVRGLSLGALNLFGRGHEVFGALDELLLATYRQQAAVALANARAYAESLRLAEQLREAMASRATIEQAKGIVMVLCDVDAEAAFGLLTDLSQRRNAKLRTVAEQVVRERRV